MKLHEWQLAQTEAHKRETLRAALVELGAPGFLADSADLNYTHPKMAALTLYSNYLKSNEKPEKTASRPTGARIP